VSVDLLDLTFEDRHLVSCPLTPGFFIQAPSAIQATRVYVEILKSLGPMPMLDTPATAKVQSALKPGQRTNYIGFPKDLNFGDRWMYQALERRLPQLAFAHPKNALDRWRCVLPRGHYDLTLLGGGTLINQKPQFFQDVASSLAAGVPCVCFGTGVGNPERWGDHLEAWVELLRQFRFVGIRGPRSHELLAARGMRDHVITGDPCLLDEPSFGERPAQGPYQVWVDVSFGVQETPASIEFRFRLLRALGGLESSGRAQLHFYTTWEVYRPWIQLMLENCLASKREVTVLNERSRPEIQRADLCIAYRLHAGAVALMFGVPTLMVEYEPKCRDFAAFLELEAFVIEPSRAGAEQIEGMLSERLEATVKARDEVQQAVGAGKLRTEQAFGHFVQRLKDLR